MPYPRFRNLMIVLALIATTFVPTLMAGPGSQVGSEFRVNTRTISDQRYPSTAMDADGNFVVTWSSWHQDANNTDGVFAQRFNASGVAQGGEFQVNTYVAGNQFESSVAMDADGDFVVVWTSQHQSQSEAAQDGDGSGIFAQRYNASGIAQGGEFQVNTYTTNYQSSPSVAMDPAGHFVVAWVSNGQDGDAYGVYAQRFDAAGAAQGAEFMVNTTTAGYQVAPDVAMNAVGDFVVTWNSDGQDGDAYGVYAQRFNAAGVAQGSEFQVNTTTEGNQVSPAIAMNAAGDFAVSWWTYETEEQRVYARRYDASGASQGGEFQVNTTSGGSKQLPDVAMSADGDFVVVWQSAPQDGSQDAVVGQRYSAAGVAYGEEFLVNTYKTDNQGYASLAMDVNGGFVVAWMSRYQDGSQEGIYAQRYAADGGPAPACPVAPRNDCVLFPSGSLAYANRNDDTRDKFRFSAAGGDTSSTSLLFGNPAASTGNTLCVYDSTGLLMQMQVDAGGSNAVGKPLWKSKSGKNSYKNKTGSTQGVLAMSQAPGTKASVKLRAGGADLPDLSPPFVFPLTVQNLTSGDVCTSTALDSFKSNTPGSVSASTSKK
jgi:hypothetical protein